MVTYRTWHSIAIIYLFSLVFVFAPFSLSGQCSIVGDDSVCKGELGMYKLNTGLTGDTSFLWHINQGGTISGLPNRSQVKVFWQQAGNWIVSGEVFVNGVLIERCSFNVNITELAVSFEYLDFGNPLPGEVFQDKSYYCIGDTIVIDVNSLNGPVDYVWDLHGVEVNSTELLNGIQISFVETGTVILCATVTNASNCVEVICEQFDIIDPSGVSFEPFPNPALADTLKICKGQIYYFNNTSSPILGSSYKWTVEHNSNTWTFYSDEINFPFDSSGTYVIKLYRGFDTPACQYEPAEYVVVVSENMITPIICPTPVCEDEEICYEAAFDCSKYSWSVSTEGTSSGDTTNKEFCVDWDMVSGNTLGAISLVVQDCTVDFCTNPTVAYIPLIPASVEISGNEMICGGSENYSVPSFFGVNFEWSYTIINGSGTIIDSFTNSFSQTIDFNDFAGTILLSVVGMQNMGSCSFAASKVITIYNSRIEMDSLHCFGANIEASLTPPSSEPIDWFVYDVFKNEVYKELMSTSSISIPSSEGLPSGQYTIIVMMPGGFPGACMVQKQFTILDPVPSPIIRGPSIACPDTIYEYSSSFSGEHDWTVTGGDIDGSSSMPKVKIKWTATTGPYILRVRRKESGCWSDYAIREIMVQDPDNLMITGNTQPCPDNIDPEIYYLSFPGATGIQWKILPPYSHLGSIILGSSPDSIGILWHFSDVSGIQLVATATGCNQTISDTLVIDLTPFSPAYNWPDTICQFSNVEFEAPDAETFSWFIDGIQFAEDTQQVFEHTFLEHGIFFITSVLGNPGNCAGAFSITDTLVVLPSPVASIFLSEPLPCPEGTPFDSIFLETLEYPGFENVTYSWTYNGNVIGTDSKVMISDTGLYSLSVSIGGCNQRGNFNVQYNCDAACSCDPDVHVKIDTLYLIGNSCGDFLIDGTINPFTDSSVIDRKYIFPLPIGTIQLNDPSELLQLENYQEPGIYHIRLQVDWLCENDTICKETDAAALRIPVISDFEWHFTCIGDGEEYLVTVQDASRAIDSLDVNEWESPNGVESDVQSIQFEATAGDIVEVCLKQTTLEGYSCTNCDTIIVPQIPIVDFTIDAPGFCLNSEVQMIPLLTPLNDVASATWDFGDGSLSHIVSPVKKYTDTGEYVITLSVITDYGCSIEAVDTFEVLKTTLKGEIVTTQDFCSDSALLSFDLENGGPIASWLWSTNETDSTIIVTMTDSYRVTVTDVNGCTFRSNGELVQIKPPFCDGIDGALSHCTSINLSVCQSGGYDYNWFVSGPGYADTLLSSYSYIRPNLAPGFYQVTVVATDSIFDCSETSVEVEILGTPAPPEIDISIINCKPSQVLLTADTIVDWSINNNITTLLTAMEIALTNFGNRTIRATKTDENGCKAFATISIPSVINFSSIGTGCGEACPDSVLAGLVHLNGISGIYEEWEWRLEGSPILGASGSNDTITPLQVDTSYFNKYITLVIEHNGCIEESPLFFIKEIECPSTCPDSLIVEANTNDIMALFGDVDCDEYVYYVRGSYVIPQGYVFCDSIPVFEGGYFVYDEFLYSLNPSSNSVTFSGHLYVTDMVLYMSNPGLIGQFLICDASTGAVCPAKVTIQYRAPMLGMMCNFTHCLNCSPCNNTLGQNVPVKSCMTLQFPTCYDDCGINEYILNIIMPNDSGLLGPVIHSDTIVWDSMGISQEYCFEYSVKYRTIPCYYVQLTSNCGHSCLSSFCLNSLQTCNIIPIMPLKQGHNQFYLEQSELEIYPNPNNGDLIHLKAGNVTSGGAYLTIYSLDGGIVLKEDVSFSGQNASIQTSNLTQGTYVISVQDKVTGLRCTSRYVHMD